MYEAEELLDRKFEKSPPGRSEGRACCAAAAARFASAAWGEWSDRGRVEGMDSQSVLQGWIMKGCDGRLCYDRYCRTTMCDEGGRVL